MRRMVHFHRGVAGWFFEIAFYLFNLVMLVTLLVSLANSGDVLAAAEGALSRGIAGFGAAARVVVLLIVWVIGDVILALVTLIARGRKASIEDVPNTL